jgi:hypothetical protein
MPLRLLATTALAHDWPVVGQRSRRLKNLHKSSSVFKKNRNIHKPKYVQIYAELVKTYFTSKKVKEFAHIIISASSPECPNLPRHALSETFPHENICLFYNFLPNRAFMMS